METSGSKQWEVMLFCAMFLYYTGNVSALVKCDFMPCRSLIKSVARFLSDERENPCVDPRSSLQCARNCLHQIYPHFSQSLPTTRGNDYLKQLCSNNIPRYNYGAGSNCIFSHIDQLLACIVVTRSTYLNQVQNAVFSNSVVCGETQAIMKCPGNVLADNCGKEAVEVLEKLFKFIFEDIRKSSCHGISVGEIRVPSVEYHLGNEYWTIATCVDSHFLQVNNCIDQYLQEYIDVRDYSCGDESMNECVSLSAPACFEDLTSTRDFLTNILSFGSWKCESLLAMSTQKSGLQTENPQYTGFLEVLNMSDPVSLSEAPSAYPSTNQPVVSEAVEMKTETPSTSSTTTTTSRSIQKDMRELSNAFLEDMQGDQNHSVNATSVHLFQTESNSTLISNKTIRDHIDTSPSNCGIAIHKNFILIFLGFLICCSCICCTKLYSIKNLYYL